MKELMVALLMFGPLVPATVGLQSTASEVFAIKYRDLLEIIWSGKNWNRTHSSVDEFDSVTVMPNCFLNHEHQSEKIIAQIAKFRTNPILRCLLDFHK